MFEAARRLGFAACLLAASGAADAADKVEVGVFNISASLPYFVAAERGFFAEQGIEPVYHQMASSTLIVGGFLNGDLEAAAALVAIEGVNANLKKPGAAMYLSLNGQNAEHRQETIVVRKGLEVASIKDLKGKATKIMAASGPANTAMARAVLKLNGLEEGKDFTLTDLAVNLHVSAITAGTYDAGYTLEPAGTIMVTNGAATALEAGVIATYVLGRRDAQAFAAGGAVTSKFIQERPDVAKRYARAWRKALAAIKADPTTRDHLKGNTPTPPDLITKVGIPSFTMISDLTPQALADFQRFIDFATDMGVLKERVETVKLLVELD
jgi:NitT/TauT family transport system substrate-binding protein